MYLVKLNGNNFLVNEVNMVCNFMTNIEIKNIKLPLHNRIPVPFYDTFKVKMLMFCGERDLFYKEVISVINILEITIGYKVSLVIKSQNQCRLHITFTKMVVEYYGGYECFKPTIDNIAIIDNNNNVNFDIVKSSNLTYGMEIPYEFVHTIMTYQDDEYIYKILRNIEMMTAHGFIRLLNNGE